MHGAPVTLHVAFPTNWLFWVITIVLVMVPEMSVAWTSPIEEASKAAAGTNFMSFIYSPLDSDFHLGIRVDLTSCSREARMCRLQDIRRIVGEYSGTSQ